MTFPGADETRHDPPPGGGETLRFGPGVRPLPDRMVEAWRGGQPSRPPGRRLRGLISGLITAALLAGVLAFLLLRGQGGDLQVTGVTVQAPDRPQPCSTDVAISAVVTTNGESGRITYRWLRSDGPAVGPLSQPVESGHKQLSVPPLSWTIKGEGRKRFIATFELIEPSSSKGRASDAFTYVCR